MLFNLPGDYCVKVDCANMAHSVESRSPFLEHSIIDFTSKIPTAILLENGEQKHILKEISKKYIPKKNIYRKKQGFSIPLKDWLLSEKGQKLIKEVSNGLQVKNNFINKDGF